MMGVVLGKRYAKIMRLLSQTFLMCGHSILLLRTVKLSNQCIVETLSSYSIVNNVYKVTYPSASLDDDIIGQGPTERGENIRYGHSKDIDKC